MKKELEINGSESSIVKYFSELKDPRLEQGKRHLLKDIITIAICAMICGADDYEEMEEFGKEREKWLKNFLELPHGIPSHDTFGRIFALIDPKAFQDCFLKWMQSIHKMSNGKIISIDGKTLRHSYDTESNQSAIHLVSAWLNENQLTLGQIKVDQKSNEIKAIPELLEMLDLKGATITIDAMGCQKDIVSKIIEKKADYVLGLKGNQGLLHRDVSEYMNNVCKCELKTEQYDFYKTIEKDHGRIEERKYWSMAVPKGLENKEEWLDLKSIIMVESNRTVIGKESTIHRRYYISSLETNAQALAKAIRTHWGIENSLHWQLDVTFNEDQSRVRKDHGPENLAMLRRATASLLKQEKSTKKSIKVKRLKAAWNVDYLEKILWAN